METIIDSTNETIFVTREDKKEIIIIKDDYNKLNHIQKLELLFTLKNWVTDELNKIANE